MQSYDSNNYIILFNIHSRDKSGYWFLNIVCFPVDELFFTILIKRAQTFFEKVKVDFLYYNLHFLYMKQICQNVSTVNNYQEK